MRAGRVAAALAACSMFLAAAQAGTLQGTALYRERIAAPPDAVFEATLQNVSRADAPAVVLGRARIEPAGNPPYRFEIAYDDAAVRPGARYVVRATLRSGERLLFTTDTTYPVLDGRTDPLSLVMVSASRGPSLPPLPASFAGEIPGAGGPLQWQLDLLPGGRYQLRQTFVGRPEPNHFDDIGRWRLDRQRNRFELIGTRQETLYFEAADNALRKLDMAGRRIEGSSHNDLLVRMPQPAPIEPRLALTGMFRYLADAASITLCADGRRLPVAMEADYLALERAYSAADPKGQPLLVSLEGLIAPRRLGEEGAAPKPALVVERFDGLWPRETCGQPLATTPLRNTYWKLTRLDGASVVVAARQREPHLVLNAKEPRVAGSSGCNRVMGGFELDGDALRFGRLAGTMMACPEGMAQERTFLDALGQVAHWQVHGSHLEFFDAQRKLLARFEAVALR